MVAGIGSLSTIARYKPNNLVVVVFNNGVYGTTGDGQTKTAAGAGLDIPKVAVASGFDPEQVREVGDINGLRSALETAMTKPGPWLICIDIEAESGGARRRYPIPGRDIV